MAKQKATDLVQMKTEAPPGLLGMGVGSDEIRQCWMVWGGQVGLIQGANEYWPIRPQNHVRRKKVKRPDLRSGFQRDCQVLVAVRLFVRIGARTVGRESL